MNKKKILFITQYFYPENFKGNDIAWHLAKENDVTVVTAVPNYPQGSFFPGYGLFLRNKEIINGVEVIRVPVFPRGDGHAIGLALNYFSYAFFATLYVLYLAAFRGRFDMVFVQQLSPITLALPGVFYKKIKKIPLYLWVLDLWPESLQSASNISNEHIINFFEKVTRYIYRNSDKILISSKGFKQSIVYKGVNENKIIYFPNWAEDVFSNNTSSPIQIPNLPEGFKVMFAGNIGEAQDFEAIMKAALDLKEQKQIKFIIIGDGRKKDWVENYIRENALHDTVYLLGRHPLETMPLFFEQADCMLVTLKDEPVFNLTAPAKIQAYMAAGKPIIGMLNGEGANLIKEAECGMAVGAGDYAQLANNILYTYSQLQDKLTVMGQNSKKYYFENFSKRNVLDQLIRVLENEI